MSTTQTFKPRRPASRQQKLRKVDRRLKTIVQNKELYPSEVRRRWIDDLLDYRAELEEAKPCS